MQIYYWPHYLADWTQWPGAGLGQGQHRQLCWQNKSLQSPANDWSPPIKAWKSLFSSNIEDKIFNIAPKLVSPRRNRSERRVAYDLWGQVAHMVTFVSCNGCAADNTRHNGDCRLEQAHNDQCWWGLIAEARFGAIFWGSLSRHDSVSRCCEWQCGDQWLVVTRTRTLCKYWDVLWGWWLLLWGNVGQYYHCDYGECGHMRWLDPHHTGHFL